MKNVAKIKFMFEISLFTWFIKWYEIILIKLTFDQS